MRRFWIAAMIAVAGLCVAGWMPTAAAQDENSGGVLPPPSLYDEPASQRKAEQPATPASAKPAESQSPSANEAPPRKKWWKPSTWFSKRQPGAEPAPATQPAPASPPAPVSQPAPAAEPTPAVLPTAQPAAPVMESAPSEVAAQETSLPSPQPLSSAAPPMDTSMAEEGGNRTQPVPKTSGNVPAPMAAQPKAPAARRIQERPLSMSMEAPFESGSAALTAAAKKQLDQLAIRLADGDYQIVRVVGHVDAVENAAGDAHLSGSRAKAAKDYLVAKGLVPGRIAIQGQGASDPITRPGQCDRLEPKARTACTAPDRRAEITVTRALSKKK